MRTAPGRGELYRIQMKAAHDETMKYDRARRRGEEIGRELALTQEGVIAIPTFETINELESFFAGAYCAYKHEVTAPLMTMADFEKILKSRGEMPL